MIKIYKTCGILGGMGPYATSFFFKNILDNTKAKKDWDHVRLIIDNNIYIPSRTRHILFKEKSPINDIVKSINNLSKIGCDFVALPCNSVHYYYDKVSLDININWLNMIEIVSNKVKKNGFSKPLILGGYVTTNKKIYTKYIPNAFYLSRDDNVKIESLIEIIKKRSSLKDDEYMVLKEIFMRYKGKYDSVILACTEFSIINQKFKYLDIPFFDSNNIYAKSIIKFSKQI